MFRSPFGVTRRAFLKAAAGGMAVPALARAQTSAHRETLYNGITLSSPWPPVRGQLSDTPQRPPYLASPPEVINIDVGRQLFVDDFLVEESALHRTFHQATYHPDNPLLSPERDWELRDPHAALTGTPPSPSAMVFSDGVFFDPAERVFKMWYMSGYQQDTALALSADGITWERPNLDVVRGTNIVSRRQRDSNTVWLDLDTRDANARYKMAGYDLGLKALRLHVSRDGVHWREVGVSGPCGDRSTFFYNPFRKVWVFSLRRDENGMNRSRRYVESRDFAWTRWTASDPVLWTGADTADLARPEMATVPRQLYNLDAVAYESVLLGLFSIYRGERPDREKPIDLCVAFSRDGFHWSRLSREPFIPVSERQGDWNWANVQSAGGGCVLVGDRLHFYVSGRQGIPGTALPGICSTGLATLRRDGFASMSDTWPSGTPRQIGNRAGLTTRPIKFSGRYLFVNADVDGELKVDVIDKNGRAIEAFSADRCIPVTGHATRLPVQWKGGVTLEELSGQEVRFRFNLTRARLYSFWVSPSPRGESRGYVAAGGPAYRSHYDG
ncbi:MAG: glycosyl hydrolase family 32 [Acidobacteriota bacterium]|nr:glycosyl hydrolase family 32 [Acidobacteriota bacterium]